MGFWNDLIRSTRDLKWFKRILLWFRKILLEIRYPILNYHPENYIKWLFYACSYIRIIKGRHVICWRYEKILYQNNNNKVSMHFPLLMFILFVFQSVITWNWKKEILGFGYAEGTDGGILCHWLVEWGWQTKFNSLFVYRLHNLFIFV